MKEIKELRAKMIANIKECEKAIKSAAKAGNFTECIKLVGMIDSYKRVKWDLDKILAKLMD